MTIEDFVKENEALQRKLLKELCLIPAPSHHEENRAAYCKNILDGFGVKGVYIDEAKNVVYPINCDGQNSITVLAGHTDTVFPDTDPLPYYEKDGKIYSPGVGDDTAAVVDLLLISKYIIENNIVPQKGLLIVCNACEEGLGNLKGTRQIMSDYQGRVERFVSIDANYTQIFNECVGSHRYEVSIATEGGHSFSDFGNANAIVELSKIVSEIYKITVPNDGVHKTTYNVGSIEGGTSINTIPQSAKMLCEYRSDSVADLAFMESKFNEIFTSARSRGLDISVNRIGERPCANNLDNAKQMELSELCRTTIEGIIGKSIVYQSASTDCNIPLSLGIPAIAFGAIIGAGEHTREEYLEIDSLSIGLNVALNVAMELIK